jgi:hypothetical protein
MLWFFAVAAAIGAALWGAVRIEQGVGPVPVGDSGPGSAGKALRCRPVGGRLPGVAGKAAGTWRAAGGRACRTATPVPRSCIAVGKPAFAGTSA